MPTILLLYIPVLHRGYLELLRQQSALVDELCIIGSDIIQDFPLVQREIRAISPEDMRDIIEGLRLFKSVRVVNKSELNDLHPARVLLANETISRELAKQYFPNIPVEYLPVFLRWDEQTVPSQKPVEYDATISQNDFDEKIMRLAKNEAKHSPDWFRQVGAVLVKDGQIIFTRHNLRLPSPQAAYAEGDPRNYVELGTSSHLHNGLHAEQYIIAEAARQGISLEGASLYVTTFPCPDCSALIAHSGIKKCFFASGYAMLDGQTTLKQHGVALILVQPMDKKTASSIDKAVG